MGDTMHPMTSAETPARERSLKREITAVLLFKLFAITLLWYLFFGPTHRVPVTPERVQQSLFAPGAGTPPAHGDDGHA